MCRCGLWGATAVGLAGARLVTPMLAGYPVPVPSPRPKRLGHASSGATVPHPLHHRLHQVVSHPVDVSKGLRRCRAVLARRYRTIHRGHQ